MKEHLILVFMLIGFVGIGAQWLAWRLRLPAIILLILGGLIVGPGLGWIQPSKDLGNLLQPIIGLAVALILFEGGLNLRWHEYKETGVNVNRLVSIGLLLTWLLSSLAAHYLGNLSWPVAILFGAIIIVTGPTVIIPLLKQARLQRRGAALLKWEGIINDPIGALIAVLVFEYFAASEHHPELADMAGNLGLAILVSSLIGIAAGYALGWSFRRDHVPEFLKSPVMLVSVIIVYTAVNHVQEEAGLLAVTIFGVVLGNQELRSIEELRRFKEYITILLVSGVFVMLTADIDISILSMLNWNSVALLICIVFVVRPLTVYLSTIGTGIAWQDRTLLAWIAPRGIVAAAVAGIFAPQMVDRGYEGAEQLLPLVFSLIVITVVLHGLSIKWLARKLGLAAENPHGLLIVGASPWSVELAKIIQERNVPVILSDSSWHHLRFARMTGVSTHHGEILSERSEEKLELNAMSHVLAATANDAYNALVCTRFAPEFGRNSVFQLPHLEKHEVDKKAMARTIRGRIAFGENARYEDLMRRHYQGWVFRKTLLSENYDYQTLLKEKNENTILIAIVDDQGEIKFYPIDESVEPETGDTVISFGPKKT
jgi:NhaP-type Na+/H+ or K+/H+ antiporter